MKVSASTRGWALFIDLMVLGFPQVVVFTLLKGIWILFLDLVIWIAYCVYFDGRRGATPGKILLGIRIVRSDGSAIGYWEALARCLGKILPMLPLFLSGAFALWTQQPIFYKSAAVLIGLIIPLLWSIPIRRNDRGRSLHDRIVDTRVMRLF